MSEILKAANDLYRLGLAIHWLMPKSKRPVESGWTAGPRKSWAELLSTYRKGYNVGVRLGTPSKFERGFLAVIDIDIKSENPEHRKEALARAKELVGGASNSPCVVSGRGNGSRHIYVLTREPFKTYNPAASESFVKVPMPSKKPSRAELESLTQEELDQGLRISRAWEISLYSDGRQVVLPPSIHPDTGAEYRWKVPFAPERLQVIKVNPPVDGPGSRTVRSTAARPTAARSGSGEESGDFSFTPVEVELEWLPIPEKIRNGIQHGANVADRSGFLLPASLALHSAGLTHNEILSVLTDRSYFLGNCAFDHAKTNSRERAAQWVYRYTLARVSAERSAEGVFDTPTPDVRKLSEDENIEWSAELLDGDWQKQIIRSGQHGDGPPRALVGNVVLILRNAVAQDLVRRDEFASRDTYSCETPWGGKTGQIVSDDDVTNIKFWLGHTWNFEPNKDIIYDALTVIARQNSYDPVRDMLDGMPEWDGKKRLDGWLKKYFEAQGDEEYLAQVFRKWMVAMVLRVYKPGAKVDWMPIFEGPQGIGKSSFGRVLVGDKYFLDWLPNLHDKDAALGLQGFWAVELGELSQFRRNELETIKAFITRTVDKLRPPYGRKLIESARRCVFFGTTNRSKYLVDDTGNRRFKPVLVGSLNFGALRRDRLQLFAEAKHLLDEKIETEFSLELVGDAKTYEREIHGEKMIEDDSTAMLEEMLDFIDRVKREPALFDFEKFKLLELFSGEGGKVAPLVKWRYDGRTSQLAGKMLKKLNAEKRHVKGRIYWKIDLGDGFETPTPHH